MRVEKPIQETATLLSIVIITRNEAQNISRCIESALVAADPFPGTEIVLVDSASTDGTIDIARRFPVSVIQLRPDWPLTPGAGRYIGTLATSSEYILFLDGDTQVYSDWLPQALDFLRQNLEVAGVGGTLDEFYLDEEGQPAGEVYHRYSVRRATQVTALGGNGLYRRAALDRVGTFHPYLAWREEAELALRLRKAGYTLWQLPLSMAQHLSSPRSTFREAMRRFQVGFYPKAGRTLRAAYKQRFAGQFAREFLMNYLVTGGYLLIGLVALVGVLAGCGQWLRAWLIVSAVVFAAYSVRKRSPRQAFGDLVARLMVTYGLIAGFFTGGRDADQYPTNVIVLQRQDARTPSPQTTW